jgi:Putative MetA-pathway of phenol degradation
VFEKASSLAAQPTIGQSTGGRYHGPNRVCRAFGALIYGCAVVASFATTADAGSARDYLNAPIDTWLTFYNFAYSTLVTPEDGLDVTSSIRSNVLSQSIVVTRTMDYWGRTGGFSLILPYRYLNSSSDTFRASSQGISDVGFLWQMNIFGGPALTKEQFRYFVPQTFASFHLAVTTPLGSYQPTDPLNASANRWMINPTINYSYTFDRGWTWLEAYLSTRVFTPNNDYRVGGASRLTQKPLYIVEGHASRNLLRLLWISADAYYNIGGETSIDDLDQRNAANTLRLGVGMGVTVWRGGDVVLNYDHVVARPAGQPDAQAILMTVRQLW